MESEILEAARRGKVEELKAILERDPIALERMQVISELENPLHVAALTEQVDFAKEILRRKPCLGWEVNKDGLVPLHMASATGNLELVRLMMEADPEMCLLRDKGGWTSLHFAALRGRVEVVKELLRRCPRAAQEVTFQGDNALHLAVKNSRVDVAKALLEAVRDDQPAKEQLLRAPDAHGRTVSHLALATKQIQVPYISITQEHN